MSEQEIKKGDEVSWQWGGGAPGGTATEVKADTVSIQSHRGNEIKKHGDESDPAVKVSRGGNDVVKKASELDVEKKADDKAEGEKDGKKDAEKEEAKKEEKQQENGDSADKSKTNGEETKGGDEEGDKKEEENKDDAEKKGKAAPKKPAEKKEKPAPKEKKEKPAPKKESKPKKRAATESGEPRRSKRNRT